MAEEGADQDKSEEATPFKLKRARERGMVARGMDLGFLSGMAALACFLAMAGEAAIRQLAEMMRRTLAVSIAQAGNPVAATQSVQSAYPAAFGPVLLFAGTALALVALTEVIQLKGLSFSAQPLKPDFSRINPGKGLKRLFSMRMLKEALKSIVKLSLYAIGAALVVRGALGGPEAWITDGQTLAAALRSSAMRLIWTFLGLAIVAAAIDQFMARREFAKQMRMSRRDVTREAKDREGDPRLKRKRKQLHAEFAKRSAAFGALPGSDMLVVNPEHFAVALVYQPSRDPAPMVRTKARNFHALAMKRRARQLNIPIFERPLLARALHAECDIGGEVPSAHYRAVAELYLTLQPRKGDEESLR